MDSGITSMFDVLKSHDTGFFKEILRFSIKRFDSDKKNLSQFGRSKPVFPIAILLALMSC
jgi:hypothetical protein